MIEARNEVSPKSQVWQWDLKAIYGFDTINIHESMLI